MKELINGQSLRFDPHDSGSGKSISWGEGIHLHKTMNSDRYNGAEVLIYFDEDRNLEFRKIRGRNKDIENRIVNEMSRALNKDEQKQKEFAKYVYNQIERFTSRMSHGEKIEILRNGAEIIAKQFKLKPGKKEIIKRHFFSLLKSYITVHEDEDGKKYFIVQDIEGKSIKIGENLNILKEELKVK